MSTLMESLKESTRPMHDQAEGSRFQSLLANGRLPLDSYVQYLGQLFLVHRHLEQAILQSRESGKNQMSVVSDSQLQEPHLRVDLERFDLEPETLVPVQSTRNLMQEIDNHAAASPCALLGMHYVLLGSKHGAKFIARSVKSAYELSDEAGARYFDPYGSGFMEIWKEFKNDMNELQLSSEEKKAVLDGAASMFVRFTDIGDELLTLVSVS